MNKIAGFGAAAIVATLSLSGAASAASLSVSWAPGLQGPVNANVVTPSTTYNGTAGAFQVNASGYDINGSFLAWCLDLFDYVTPGAIYNDVYSQLLAGEGAFTESGSTLLGAEREANLVKYFNWNADKVIDAGTAVAFQLGLWEIVYEAPDNATWSVGNGNFTSSTVSLANTFLEALGYADGTSEVEEGGKTYKLIFWDSEGQNQDLVSAFLVDQISAEVPLPASVFLLGGGLFALYGAGRLKRKSKAIS